MAKTKLSNQNWPIRCTKSCEIILRHQLKRDLAWCGMDFHQLAREFLSKNEHWVDYNKQFLLDKENFKNFTGKVEDMYLTSPKFTISLRDIFSHPSNNSELSKSRQRDGLKFLRDLNDTDFHPQRPELVKEFVPVIFKGQNKFIIPYSFLNRNIFEFVKHVILGYNRVISEIIIEGF
ncbi:hypothetical protein NPIL_561441 [Nephila pilipes]|uniref:Uncharacterized protein n=1 Tax=Nephila pilipes TaxID=299642 RepID=A0A8X6QZ36_NEPPI|nr:hypothetical protein NPIL_561441 [Nephila pilipes]